MDKKFVIRDLEKRKSASNLFASVPHGSKWQGDHRMGENRGKGFKKNKDSYFGSSDKKHSCEVYAPPAPDPELKEDPKIRVINRYAPPAPEPGAIEGPTIREITRYAPPAPEPEIRVDPTIREITRYAPPAPTPELSEDPSSGFRVINRYAPPSP